MSSVGSPRGPRVFGGYCYFNNASLAGELLSKRGKVAILDIDFHHGNGTQEIFAKRADVLTLSIHCDPSMEYPYYTGYAAKERGYGRARGSNLNLPLPKTAKPEGVSGGGSSGVRAIHASARRTWSSPGFDTQEADPVGGFAAPHALFLEVGCGARRGGSPDGDCQEGGYNLRALGESVPGFSKDSFH